MIGDRQGREELGLLLRDSDGRLIYKPVKSFQCKHIKSVDHELPITSPTQFLRDKN
jgi:hypothetical protein